MTDIFFTADTHFSHDNIRVYCNRPFDSVEEMDECLIKNWNSKVKANDRVYHLGDVIWSKDRANINNILKRLNGTKFLIAGNHDWTNAVHLESHFVPLPPIYELSKKQLNDNDIKIVLSHYPMRTWNCSYHGSFHCYGHEHGRLPHVHNSLDVGVDCNEFAPVSLDVLLMRIHEKNVEIALTMNEKNTENTLQNSHIRMQTLTL